MAEKIRTIVSVQADLETLIAKYNEALRKNDLDGVNALETSMREAETLYTNLKRNEVFTELSKAEAPVLAAVARHHFDVVAHKMNRENGIVTSCEMDWKPKQIDLLQFCKFCGKDTGWQHTVEKFNQLMTARAATELGMSASEIRKICDSFYMKEVSRDIEMGKTPTSNTQICKMLQRVVDEFPIERSEGSSAFYHVQNRDVAYVLMCYTKRSSKQTLTVATSKTSTLHSLLADMLHRIVTEKAYGLEYAKKKDSTATSEAKAVKVEKPAKPVKTEEPAPTKVEKPAKTRAKKVAASVEAPVTEVEKPVATVAA